MDFEQYLVEEIVVQQTMKELGNLLAEVERVFESLNKDGAECASESFEHLRGRLAKVREGLGNLERQLQREVRRKLRDANRYMKEHPLQSLGVAAMVGFLLGASVSRRN